MPAGGFEVGEFLWGSVRELGIAEEELAIGVLRQRIQHVVVGGRFHGGRQELRGIGLEVSVERLSGRRRPGIPARPFQTQSQFQYHFPAFDGQSPVESPR